MSPLDKVSFWIYASSAAAAAAGRQKNDTANNSR